MDCDLKMLKGLNRMNKPKFRAWDTWNKRMIEWEYLIDYCDIDYLFGGYDGGFGKEGPKSYEYPIPMQYSDYNDEENLDEIWESDLLEIESPKGKFIAEVVKENGTMGMVAVKGCIVDYFTDHWNDHFMPLIDLYWNENGDDGCLPKSKRLGSKYENPELLNEVE